MVAAVTGSLSQAGLVVVSDDPALSAQISQLQAITVYNVPAVLGNISQLGLVIVADDPSLDTQISQLQAIVVWRGRVANPKLRVWTYSMDDHDYYVVSLGDGDTLVYDTFSKQWSVWGNDQSKHWNACYGFNWIGSGKYGGSFGSDVICGDDNTGSLYFLDPIYPYDDDPESGPTDRIPFQCQVTGQMVIQGNSYIPCPAVQILGSIGDVASTSFTSIELEYSDDGGKSYVSAGIVAVPSADFGARVEWRSLGSMRSPGRLFRVTDAGALTRIDGLEIPTKDNS